MRTNKGHAIAPPPVAGQQLFHENLEQRERIAASFDTVLISKDARRFATIAAVPDEVESAPKARRPSTSCS
ncbi:hypothetical protein XFF6992_80072 [Xanthomonas citri pv. fuscans]|nr:hypothetical protein XFF6992_80072 [Xanthomonas citri pv. fuscans]SOO35504.1 hypothetical protein XFF6994_5390002 [Xanthomonas citri pv. fuscans]